jgi:acyl-CoA thioesterase II
MSLFDLRPGPSPARYSLTAPPGLCVGPPHLRFLFGGVGLGAAVEAMERAAGAPLIWATAQYLAQAAPNADLDIEVSLSPASRTQVQATGRVAQEVIILVRGAVGARQHATSAQWIDAPQVLPPEACGGDFHWPQTAHALRERIEIRHATPSPSEAVSPGRSLLWIRARGDLPMTTSLLAVLADFATAGVTATLGAGAKASSLDNTLRICRLVPTTWLLCDIRLHASHAGFAHSEMRMFSECGALLAVASQSMILRPMS